MRVTLIGPLRDTVTGPSRVTDGLARGLTERGHDVRIVAFGDRNIHPTAEVDHVDVVPNSVASMLRIRSAVNDRVAGHDADVVHVLKGPVAGDVRTVQGTMVILELRRRGYDRSLRDIAGAAAISLETKIAARNATTVATSPIVSDEMARYWREEPDYTIPLGVPSSYLTDPEPVDGAPRVFVPGRLCRKKGQHKVLGSLPGDVHIAGSPVDERFQLLAEINATYHGFVSRDELRRQYELADIVVVPSEHECFGITALEGLAHGCAVFTTKDVGFGRLTSWSRGVWTVPDAAEIPGIIDGLSTDRLAKMQMAARSLADHFTWERVASQYEDLYAEI